MKEPQILRDLVSEWTKKAQSGLCSDDERHAYYECAKELHEAIFRIKKDSDNLTKEENML